MSDSTKDWEKALNDSLDRLGRAMSQRHRPPPPPDQPGAEEETKQGQADAKLFFIIASAFFVLMVLTGQVIFLLPALVLAAMGARRGGWLTTPPGRNPLTTGVLGEGRVGWGATIASDAQVDPGAIIGMGATVGSGVRVAAGATVEMGVTIEKNARIERGATVKMGATVREGAVIGERAVVDWGATVEKGAVVGEGAVVGIGCTVRKGARVGDRVVTYPGQEITGGAEGASVGAAGTPPPMPIGAADDERDRRLDEVCDRLERELLSSPPRVREFLGATSETVSALRRTGHDLLKRERALRREAGSDVIARIEQERARIEARLGSETDEMVRHSLQGAVDAMDDQLRQRAVLKRNADRLDAEFTRLTWTIEGLGAQLVRLRTATASHTDSPQVDADLERSVSRLRDEIDSVACAMEEVTRDDHRHASVFEPPVDFGEGNRARDERDRLRD